MSSEGGPTPPSERIVALDALRGFALLGILVINIRLFSMPEVVLGNPTAYGDFSGANYWAWLVGHIFVEQKFITLFTVLFGGGVLLFTRNAERKGKDATTLFFKRSGWLVLFGLAHAYLLWYGDILVAYGLTAFVVFYFRDHAVRALVTIGVILISIPSLLEISMALTVESAQFANALQPAESVLRSEIEAYRGGWLDQMDHRAPTAFERQTDGYVAYTFWRVCGVMLLGMALFKRGVLTNESSARFYRRLLGVGAVSGLVIIVAGVGYIEYHDWGLTEILLWQQFNYWGSLLLAGSYIALVMLFCRRFPDALVTRGLAAVGRTAFSNYILQTVIATTIFYGHGVGLFAQVTRAEALGVVLLIWLVQVPLSMLWLRYFRYGPLEWLWRLLTYESVPPIRASGRAEETEG